jgi:hypothetical protein
MNSSLLRPFIEEEVKVGLDSIGDLKAPGADGMSSLFYKKHWHIVGADVTKEVLHFLNGGHMPRKWNDTVVVLIPKVQNPDKLKDLRPISLYNVIYNVASKVLSNQLKIIPPDVILENQSAFVPRRLITDNILIAYELTHYLQNKRSGLDSYAAIKLDMSKAYDRVEWEFLETMMLQLGFDERWVQLIMECVTTISYRIKVNGELTDEIIPSRGLRQGDPLSPYLFLICVEGFSSLLNATEGEGKLQGLSICARASSITHLLFVDDSLLLIKVNQENAIHLQNVLQLYEACSGQTINKEKSSVWFSKNCNETLRNEFLSSLGVSRRQRVKDTLAYQFIWAGLRLKCSIT